MNKYLATCPHMREVIRERGDFVTEGNKSYFRVNDVRTEIVPCGERNYVIIDETPFSQNSGIDPEGIEVKCKGCGKTYYLFPILKSTGIKSRSSIDEHRLRVIKSRN